MDLLDVPGLCNLLQLRGPWKGWTSKPSERGGSWYSCPCCWTLTGCPVSHPQVDTAIAEETRKSVQAEEIKANEKASKAQAIADDAQKDLDEALPALDAALASLRNLNKNDVTEVSTQAPHTWYPIPFCVLLAPNGVPRPTLCASFGDCALTVESRTKARSSLLVPLFLGPTPGSPKALGPAAVKSWLAGPTLPKGRTFPFFTSWYGPQVRAMQRPPPGVKLVIEAVCIMKGIKPKKVPGEKPGSKVDDYWEPGKGLLQDPGRFLESLFKFDKVTTLSTQVSQWVRHGRMVGSGKVPITSVCRCYALYSVTVCTNSSCSTHAPGEHRAVWGHWTYSLPKELSGGMTTSPSQQKSADNTGTRAGSCAYRMSPKVPPRLHSLEILLVLVKRFSTFSVLSPCLRSFSCLWLPLGSLYISPCEIFQSMGVYLLS